MVPIFTYAEVPQRNEHYKFGKGSKQLDGHLEHTYTYIILYKRVYRKNLCFSQLFPKRAFSVKKIIAL